MLLCLALVPGLMASQRIQPRGWWCPSASLLLFYLTGLFCMKESCTHRQTGRQNTQALLAFVRYVSGKQHAGGGWQKEWGKGERDNLEVWGNTTCLTATSRLMQGGKWCKQATKPLSTQQKGWWVFKKRKRDTKLVAYIHATHACAHGDRCSQLCAELSGGQKPPAFSETPMTVPISHLHFLPHAEYTEQTEINQEMQMNPADSLHN